MPTTTLSRGIITVIPASLQQIPGLGGDTSIFTMIILYLPFLFFLFYGQKFQMQMAMFEINGHLKQLNKMRNFAKNQTLTTLSKAGAKIEDAKKGLELMLNYFTILPESMDPAGIVAKVEHILDVRDDKLIREVKTLVPDLSDPDARNLENLVEATAALEQIYKILRHFYLLGKKTGNVYLIIQLQMIMSLVMIEARAYLSAVHAFRNGQPIGDGIGALVASTMIGGAETTEIAKETAVAESKFEGRRLLIVKAVGPGGNTGKPGEAVKKLIEKNKKKVKLIVMVDAALKLEGEDLGAIAEGVGAAIGGIGVDKFKIEEQASEYQIPLHAVIIKQSLADAVSLMKKEIYDSVEEVIDRIGRIVRDNTKKRQTVIIAGIGNSIGIAQ